MTSCDSRDEWSDADEEALAAIDIDINGIINNNNNGNNDSTESTLVPSTKYSLECDRILESEGTPLQRYRPNYLIVSDLASQYWCEQKLLYDFSVEVYITRAPVGEEVKVEEDVEAKVVKGKGSDIHLARELEIQVPVDVPVETKEDRWAVKLLNLYTAVHSFYHNCHIAREVPIFGCPFGSSIFVYGIIDELRYDSSTHSLKISELKTRRSSHPPKKSQQEKDKFQVGLYRQLFDELVMNKVTKAMVGDHLGLDLKRPLSKGVMAHMSLDLELDQDQKAVVATDLDHLLGVVFDKIQTLTRIQSGQVEYVHQDTKLTIAAIQLDKDEADIQRRFEESAAWWKGDRGTQGVAIEDCWKCHFCPYSSWCEWREVMAQKTSKPWSNSKGKQNSGHS